MNVNLFLIEHEYYFHLFKFNFLMVRWNLHFDHAHVCLTWLIMEVSSVYNLFSIVIWNIHE